MVTVNVVVAAPLAGVTVAGLKAQVIPAADEQENVTLFAKPPAGSDRQEKLRELAGHERRARRRCAKGEVGVGNIDGYWPRRAGSKFSISGIRRRQGMGPSRQSVDPQDGNIGVIQGRSS